MQCDGILKCSRSRESGQAFAVGVPRSTPRDCRPEAVRQGRYRSRSMVTRYRPTKSPGISMVVHLLGYSEDTSGTAANCPLWKRSVPRHHPLRHHFDPEIIRTETYRPPAFRGGYLAQETALRSGRSELRRLESFPATPRRPTSIKPIDRQ